MNLRQLAKWNLLKNCLKVLDLFHWDHSRSRMWVEKVNENRFFFCSLKIKSGPSFKRLPGSYLGGLCKTTEGRLKHCGSTELQNLMELY